MTLDASTAFAAPDSVTPPNAPRGMVSYAGVVKRWECDLNGHMNVQFFLRAFHQASAVCAAVLGPVPAATAPLRLYRFCREIFCPEAYCLESFRLQGGRFDGWVFHRMQSSDRDTTYATAVEAPTAICAALPLLEAAGIEDLLPRSLTPSPLDAPFLERDRAQALGLGLTQPAQLDHTGTVPVHEIAAKMATASHVLFERMGLTQKRIKADRINRFMLEAKFDPRQAVASGIHLRALSYLDHQPDRKTFRTLHQILDAKDGSLVASFESLMGIIDLETRRMIALPQDMADYARAMQDRPIL